MTSIAIIGAGLSGLTVAHRLREHAEVTLFEKSRGPGGRMATRYAPPYEFDHGAQFFTARSAAFRDFLQPLLQAGCVGIWKARFVELERSEVTASRPWDESHPHFVGTPRMNSIGAYLAKGLRIHLQTEVARLVDRNPGWQLETATGQALGHFDWVILTMPPAQTIELLPHSSALRRVAADRVMSACYAVMLGLPETLALDWDAARVRAADISWISANSSKPGRGKPFSLLVHSTNAWADSNVDANSDDVLDHLLAETAAVIGADIGTAQHIDLHRWRYANIGGSESGMSFVDDNRRLAACGDWFVRGRVEAAFRSGHHLAKTLRSLL